MKNINNFFAFAAIIVVLTTYGCDLFETREAEKPDQPRGSFIYAATTEDLIANFQKSIEEKNIQNYLACFSDSSFTKVDFIFLPSAGSGSIYPSLSDGWNKNNEEQYFKNLIVRTSSEEKIVLSFSDPQLFFQGDSVVYSAKYLLRIPLSGVSETQIYQGEVKFKTIRDSRFGWTIYFWQDNKNSDFPTWSELKGLFSY